jgi:hypothetical protein
MEDLAIIVGGILLTIYGSATLAFALSWPHKHWATWTTYILAGLSILTSLSILWMLRDSTGPLVVGIPIALSLTAIWNTRRRNRT